MKYRAGLTYIVKMCDIWYRQRLVYRLRYSLGPHESLLLPLFEKFFRGMKIIDLGTITREANTDDYHFRRSIVTMASYSSDHWEITDQVQCFFPWGNISNRNKTLSSLLSSYLPISLSHTLLLLSLSPCFCLSSLNSLL